MNSSLINKALITKYNSILIINNKNFITLGLNGSFIKIALIISKFDFNCSLKYWQNVL